jgi:histidine triad (HIT) family protein
MANLLSKLACSWIGRIFIRSMFVPMTLVIPSKRLRETSTLIAFYHPHPAYPFHVLIIPRLPVANLMDLPPQSADFLRDLLVTVQSIVHEHNIENGYRLIANGGSYQDFPILHFHLVAGDIQKSTIQTAGSNQKEES